MRVVGAIVILGSQILLARLMDLDSYGEYVYLLAWIMILGQVSLLGFDTSVVRFTASYIGTRSYNDLRGLLICGFAIPVGVSLVAIAAVLLIMYSFASGESGMSRPVLISALMLLPFFVLNSIRQAVLRGLKHAVQATLPDQVIRPLLIMAGGLSVYVLGSGLSVTDIFMVHTGSALIVFLVSSLILLRRIPEQVRACRSGFHLRHWINTSLPLLLMSILILIVNQTDIVMLGLLTDAASTGRFSVAARVSETALFGLIAINSIAAPMFAEHHATDNRAKLLGIAEFSALAGFLYMLVLCLLLGVSGRVVLGLFGSEYRIAYPVLLILLSGHFVSSFVGSVGNLLTMTGHQKVVATVMTGIALTNVSLNFILIPRYGMEGAAVATAISVSCLNFALYAAVIRQLEFNPGIYGYVQRRIHHKT